MGKTPVSQDISANSAFIQSEFVRLSSEFSAILHNHGHNLLPYRNIDLPIFSILSNGAKKVIIQSLSNYVEIYNDTIVAGFDIKNSAMLTWVALKKFNLTPTSDLMSHISDTVIVEIYGLDHIQIFRNIKFFEVTSYSLEDLFCRPWFELFVRSNNEITEKLIVFVGQMLTGEGRKTLAVDFGAQVVEEVGSDALLKMNLYVDHLSPAFDNTNQVAGYIAIERVTDLRARRRAELEFN